MVNGALVRRQAESFAWIMWLGSLVLTCGASLWALRRPVFVVAPTWMAFFVLTIVAERLELSRLAPTPRWASRGLVLMAVLYGAMAMVTTANAHLGARPMGVLLVGISIWQMVFDVARRTVRWHGLPRFAALGVLLGTVWTMVAGGLLAWHGWVPAGLLYDAVLHAIFVGFVLSMVFAHVPIILPAVARIVVPYHRVLFVPLGVLHAGLLARVGGDLFEADAVRRLGAVLNALSLLLFAACVLWAKKVTKEGATSVAKSVSRGGTKLRG